MSETVRARALKWGRRQKPTRPNTLRKRRARDFLVWGIALNQSFNGESFGGMGNINVIVVSETARLSAPKWGRRQKPTHPNTLRKRPGVQFPLFGELHSNSPSMVSLLERSGTSMSWLALSSLLLFFFVARAIDNWSVLGPFRKGINVDVLVPTWKHKLCQTFMKTTILGKQIWVET